jgi:tetratricopeptide (TPR) repeat protein
MRVLRITTISSEVIRALIAVVLALAVGCRAKPRAEEPPELEARAKVLRAKYSAAPDQLATALELSRVLIELSRVTSEPALRTEAEEVIRRWVEGERPSAEALVLRATIRQSRHDFQGALADLERALSIAPGNAQAWMTTSVILGVRGDPAGALRACVPLRAIAAPVAVAGCEAGAMAASGQAKQARERLERALGEHGGRATPAERVWALVILAESAIRGGDAAGAEKAFARAHAEGARDEYLLAAHADFLLDERRYSEVVTLLEREARVEPLLLRLAIAEQALGVEAAAKHRAMLGAVFAQSRARGDLTHLREEARFHLELGGDPKEALRLAAASFAEQREPQDVRLLLAAALAARDGSTALPALELIERTGLEDPRILELAGRVRAIAKPFDALAGNLFGQLAGEARQRVAGTPRIEELVAALRGAGVELKDPQQGLGATIKARYCSATMAKSGAGFSMCEFDGPQALAAGKEIAERQYAAIPDRSFHVNENTLLILRLVEKTEGAKKDAALIVELFKKM